MPLESTKILDELIDKLEDVERSQVLKHIPSPTKDEFKVKTIDEWVAWAVETYEEDKDQPEGFITWTKQQQKEWVQSLPVKKKVE